MVRYAQEHVKNHSYRETIQTLLETCSPKSQKQRITDVGRDLLRATSQTSPLKQDQLQQVAQDCIQPSFEYVQQWRLHNLSGKTVSVTTFMVKKYFCFSWCFSLCPLALFLSVGTTEKNLSVSSQIPFTRHLYTFMRHPLSLLFSRVNRPSSLKVSSYKRSSSSFTVFIVLHWTQISNSVSFLYWRTQNWTQDSRIRLTSAE